MADKTTVTMYPPVGDIPIEVQKDTVQQMKNIGWTDRKPKPKKEEK